MYTWVDLGSLFLPGGIVAAFLRAHMEEADAITKRKVIGKAIGALEAATS